jgi:hypothetical protein
MLEEAVEILLAEDNPNDVRLTLHALNRYNISNHIHVVRGRAEALEFIFCTGAYAQRNITQPRPGPRSSGRKPQREACYARSKGWRTWAWWRSTAIPYTGPCSIWCTTP